MAGSAQQLKIRRVVAPTLGARNDMIDVARPERTARFTDAAPRCPVGVGDVSPLAGSVELDTLWPHVGRRALGSTDAALHAAWNSLAAA